MELGNTTMSITSHEIITWVVRYKRDEYGDKIPVPNNNNGGGGAQQEQEYQVIWRFLPIHSACALNPRHRLLLHYYYLLLPPLVLVAMTVAVVMQQQLVHYVQSTTKVYSHYTMHVDHPVPVRHCMHY